MNLDEERTILRAAKIIGINPEEMTIEQANHVLDRYSVGENDITIRKAIKQKKTSD